MTRHTLNDEAADEAIEALRLQIEDLNQRIARQQKRVQRIQATSPNAGRKSEPKPAAETQATLADMVKNRDTLEAELEILQAGQGRRPI
jgi:predicted phage tail protein